jgi:hypothetical protein|tara:strand:- start:9 stop:392 length:384 start_codon:yes stop_codon:yes gene_type:complete
MDEAIYKILKLSNGEDIIATIVSDNNDDVKINNPLLMSVIPHITIKGQHDSLDLSPWMQHHSEQSSFTITKSTIVTSANVSPGLSKYYEYFLKKLDQWQKNIHKEDPNNDEIYDELLDDLPVGKSIH